MKTIYISFVILITAFSLSYGQDILWQKTYLPGDSSIDWVSTLDRTSDKGYVISGVANMLYCYNSYPYSFITKVDKNGNQEWTHFIRTDNFYILDFSKYLVQNEDNTYSFAAMELKYPGGDWGYFFRYEISQNGDSLYQYFNDTAKNRIKGIPYYYKTKDGNYIYSMHQQLMGGSTVFQGIYFVRIDSVGNVIWKKQLKDDSLWYQPISKPVKDLNGGFTFLTAMYEPKEQLCLIKTDEECNELWRKTLNFFERNFHEFYQTRDGGYIIVFRTDTKKNGLTNPVVARLDKKGDLMWKKEFYGDSISYIESFVENDRGDIICAGYCGDIKQLGALDTSKTQCWMLKINYDGSLAWEKKFGKKGVFNFLKHIARSADDTYIIAATIGKSLLIANVKDNSTGIETTENERTFFSPNPARDFIYLQGVSSGTKTVIFNALGFKVLESENVDRIDISSLSAGVYFARNGDYVQKLVKAD